MADIFDPKNRIAAFHAKEVQEIPCEPVPRKPSNTEQALNSIEDVSSRLDALVSELERRVSPVLMPCPALADKGEARSSSSPLADKMFNEESRLRAIAERLDLIISRVDL